MSEALPLEGVQVLEIAGMIPGPYATMLLGDLGADVIKIEEPESGDYQRDFGPETEGINHRFATYNRNKRSIAIDLKTERGMKVLHELASKSDVFIEGFRPGVVDRLGIGYDDISETNPSIVYCSLSGYGQDGPYKDWVGHDINYLGISGMLSVTGERNGPPVPPGYPISDFAGGLFAAFSILSALHHRDETDEGEYIDISMTDVVSSWSSQLLSAVAKGETPQRGQTLVSGGNPSYSIYECGDGKYITLGALEPGFWENLCKELSIEQYIDADRSDPGLQTEIRNTLSTIFRRKSRDEWIDYFDESEVPVAPVNTPFETIRQDKQIAARELITEQEVDGEKITIMDSPYTFGSDIQTIRSPAPEHGGQTEELLEELGYDSANIEKLISDGVVTNYREN